MGETAARITVNLNRQAHTAMETARHRSGHSMVDVVNRALVLYDYVEDLLQVGHEVLVRNKDTGELQTIRLL